MNKILLESQVQDFIHRTDEVSIPKIALSASPFAGITSSELAIQISGLHKAKTKLPSLYHQKGIIYPVGLSMEQCSSEYTARYKASIVGCAKRGADITGGFGVDTVFLSEGFEEFDYFEIDRELCDIAQSNFSQLSRDNIAVHCADGVAQIVCQDKRYDVIFADPARRDANASRVYSIGDCTPDIEALRGALLGKSDRLVVKLSPMLDITSALRSLPGTEQVHVVAYRNEVKELLFVISNDAKGLDITACDISSDGSLMIFDLPYDQINSGIVISKLGKYIYDPSTALRKSSLADHYAHSLGLTKLGRATSLYTCDVLIEGFQGRVFEVIGGVDKKNIKSLLPEARANVVSRGYVLSAKDVATKLKIKEGGDMFVVAYGDYLQKNTIVLVSKVIFS